MKQENVRAVNQKVYRRFPALKGKKPKIQVHGAANTSKGPGDKTYLLIYRGHAETANNKTLPVFVRVLANERGKIIQIISSH